MDEKKRILRVIDKTEDLENEVREFVVPKVSNPSKSIPHTNPQTNPIYKKLAKFVNAKIGDKWTIQDLLR